MNGELAAAEIEALRLRPYIDCDADAGLSARHVLEHGRKLGELLGMLKFKKLDHLSDLKYAIANHGIWDHERAREVGTNEDRFNEAARIVREAARWYEILGSGGFRMIVASSD